MGDLSIDKTTLLAIIIPMVALLLVGYISYESTIQFIQKDALDDRINLIIQRLEHLISTITDAETGQRGYIITDRLSYLEPYYTAVSNIHSQLGNLDIMIANEPDNQQLSLNELNMLKGLIEAKLAELKQTITLRQSYGINDVLPIILSNRGEVLMDKIRATTLDIQNHENSLLDLDTRQTQAYAQTITQTIFIATLVAAGITSVSVFVINRDIQKRHMAVQKSLQIEVEKRTEQLQIVNKELLAANEQLKLHDRMQQDFINIAAHELRTPIQPILGLAELLRRKLRDSAVGGTNNSTNKDIEHLDIIIRNAKRLLMLEQNMLDLTKIEDRSLRLDKEQFDLIENIQHLINDFSNELSKEKIQLVFTQPTEKEAILVNADKVRISEVISNLLGNAIKFTTKGVGRNITIKVEKKNSEANVSIKDTGSGIDPEIKPKLFSKFATNSPGGTGIGLFVCKSIVEAHGGSIWAENNSDAKGATFTFSLPTTEQIVFR